jgi:hypothetical protein
LSKTNGEYVVDYTETILIEQPSLTLLHSLGWQTANAHHGGPRRGPVNDRESPGWIY